jgi:hypothetical protein
VPARGTRCKQLAAGAWLCVAAPRVEALDNRALRRHCPASAGFAPMRMPLPALAFPVGSMQPTAEPYFFTRLGSTPQRPPGTTSSVSMTPLRRVVVLELLPLIDQAVAGPIRPSRDGAAAAGRRSAQLGRAVIGGHDAAPFPPRRRGAAVRRSERASRKC